MCFFFIEAIYGGHLHYILSESCDMNELRVQMSAQYNIMYVRGGMSYNN
jgi:hypothetical protein